MHATRHKHEREIGLSSIVLGLRDRNLQAPENYTHQRSRCCGVFALTCVHGSAVCSTPFIFFVISCVLDIVATALDCVELLSIVYFSVRCHPGTTP